MIINNKIYLYIPYKKIEKCTIFPKKQELSGKVGNREPIYYRVSHIKVEIEKKKFGMRAFFRRRDRNLQNLILYLI